jgi:hypothetical protein
LRRARPAALPTTDGQRYLCQATELTRATQHLPAYDLRQFLRALWGEDTRPLDLLRAMVIFVRDTLAWRLFHRPHWEWNFLPGPCDRTPAGDLNLQAGERVRVRSKEEILATLDGRGWNRAWSSRARCSSTAGRSTRSCGGWSGSSAISRERWSPCATR